MVGEYVKQVLVALIFIGKSKGGLMLFSLIMTFVGVCQDIFLRIRESLSRTKKDKPCGGFSYQYVFNPFIVILFFLMVATVFSIIYVFVFVVPVAGLARGATDVNCWYCPGGVDVFVVVRWLWFELNALYFFVTAFLVWPFVIGFLDYTSEAIEE